MSKQSSWEMYLFMYLLNAPMKWKKRKNIFGNISLLFQKIKNTTTTFCRELKNPMWWSCREENALPIYIYIGRNPLLATIVFAQWENTRSSYNYIKTGPCNREGQRCHTLSFLRKLTLKMSIQLIQYLHAKMYPNLRIALMMMIRTLITSFWRKMKKSDQKAKHHVVSLVSICFILDWC